MSSQKLPAVKEHIFEAELYHIKITSRNLMTVKVVETGR